METGVRLFCLFCLCVLGSAQALPALAEPEIPKPLSRPGMGTHSRPPWERNSFEGESRTGSQLGVSSAPGVETLVPSDRPPRSTSEENTHIYKPWA